MIIDKDSPIPLYKQVKSYLLEYIERNGADSGQIPTEDEMSRDLGISRGTVKAAVKELVQEKKLKRVPGKGTFIRSEPRAVSFATWLSLENYSAVPLEKVLSAYTQENSNIRVNLSAVPYEKYEHQLMLMTAAGKAPDIGSMVYLWLPAFAHQGALLPLDGLLSDAVRKNMYPGSLRAALYRGKHYGFTLANGPAILFYNRDILSNYTGTPEPELRDYNDLSEACGQIYAKSEEEIIPFSIPISDDELFFLYTVYNFLLGFGGGMIDEDGEVCFHSDNNIRAFSWLRGFLQNGHVSTKYNFREERVLFSRKKIAFSIEAPWLKGIIPTLNPSYPPETLGFSTMPKGPNGTNASILYNIILAIFKQNADPALSVEFAQYLCRNTESCRLFYTEAGFLPGYTDITEQDPVYGDPFGRVLQEQMNAAVPIPSNHPSFLLSVVFCAKAAREILLGGKQPAPVLNAAAEILQELYRQ